MDHRCRMNTQHSNAITGFIGRRLVDATRHSLGGLSVLWSQEAFRVEAALFLVLAPLALWLGDGTVERVVLIASLFAVMIVETLNTAIEVAIDRISFELHPLSKASKDLGSAAVLLAIVMAIVVWALVLFGH